MLYQFIEQAKADGSIKDSKKMLNEAERLEVKSKAPLLLSKVIFDAGIIKQIDYYHELLLRFCGENKRVLY